MLRPITILFILMAFAGRGMALAPPDSSKVWDDESKLIFSLKTNADLLKSDNIGHLYLISNEEILKIDQNGDTLFVASNKSTGDIDQIDVNFALKTLIFHKNQNSITFLDNTLTPQESVVNLDDFEIYTPLAACKSYQGNKVWVFNQDNSELFKIDSGGEIEYRSGNLRQQIDDRIEITSMVEYKNKLYANSPELGILVFDIFGTFIKKINQDRVETFKVYDDHIILKRDGQFFIKSHLEGRKMLPIAKEYDYLEIVGTKMFTLKNGRLKAFNIKP